MTRATDRARNIHVIQRPRVYALPLKESMAVTDNMEASSEHRPFGLYWIKY